MAQLYAATKTPPLARQWSFGAAALVAHGDLSAAACFLLWARTAWTGLFLNRPSVWYSTQRQLTNCWALHNLNDAGTVAIARVPQSLKL